jgi:hypothetical protein
MQRRPGKMKGYLWVLPVALGVVLLVVALVLRSAKSK